jgi:hypothetical protein
MLPSVVNRGGAVAVIVTAHSAATGQLGRSELAKPLRHWNVRNAVAIVVRAGDASGSKFKDAQGGSPSIAFLRAGLWAAASQSQILTAHRRYGDRRLNAYFFDGGAFRVTFLRADGNRKQTGQSESGSDRQSSYERFSRF